MINREILCGILADTYEVLDAENGQDAMDAVLCAGEELEPYRILRSVRIPPGRGKNPAGISQPCFL